MAVTKKLNRIVMLVAIAGTLALGSLSVGLYGIGTSPGNTAHTASFNANNRVALKLSGINGESLDDGHHQEIEVICLTCDSKTQK